MTSLKPASLGVLIAAALFASVSVATADGPYEPNETATQAAGPLAGGSPYNGVIETSNDVDWFFFYTAGQRQFEVVLTWRGGENRCYTTLTLRDRDGDEQGSASVDGEPDNTVDRITLTSPGSARYSLEVNGCEGDAYTVRVTPAGAVTSQPPTRCFNHVHRRLHRHRKRHRHTRRHRHASRRVHIHRRIHVHRRNHIHRRNHPHCVPDP